MKKLLMSMRVTEASSYHEERNSIAFEYIEFFEKLGFLIILVPNNTDNIENYINEEIDLVVLSGGNNVDPKRYGSDDLLGDIYELRDNLEYSLIRGAIERKIPIIGICKGFHLLNVYFNGTLSHNIEDHVNKIHELQSSLSFLHGQDVNSYHNQAVLKENLSSELESIASVNDIIEAFLHKREKVLGIQWHPEREKIECDRELIKKFLKGKI